jgi:hypothetical protein
MCAQTLTSGGVVGHQSEVANIRIVERSAESKVQTLVNVAWHWGHALDVL